MLNQSRVSFFCGLLFSLLLISINVQGESPDAGLDDLYKIIIKNQDEANLLNRSGLDYVLKISDGYLVLAKSGSESQLNSLGLEYQLIAAGQSRRILAVDISWDDNNLEKYPVVFSEKGLRLLQVDQSVWEKRSEYTGLTRLPSKSLTAVYKKPINLDMNKVRDIDYDSLVSLILQDSLYSYTAALQAFPPRVTGSQSGYDSRDWIRDKFLEFGYDSVVYDTFYYSGDNVQNIVAYKTGTILPDHQIVIGGHKDAVSGSPGADDNGSGTAGVLEIARVLKDIDTDMTFIFICFTGEEQGLNGSWHYADDAAANGDSIVMMLNMDMIANEGNSGDVKLYHGSDQTYAELFQYLADSLTAINITGHLSGTISASDHYPFQQNGYDVVMPHEYIFSSVYHSYQDSTSHMDFPYMTKVVKASLATAYSVDGSYIPTPALTFSYPGGLPETMQPGSDTTFQIQIDGSSGGSHIEGTGQIYYSTDGANYTAEYMTSLGNGLYDATLPALTCEDGQVYFYFSGEEQTEGTYYDRGPVNPYVTFIATEITLAYFEDFDKGTVGWSISGGTWAVGEPTGGGGQYGGPDPSAAFSAPNVFGYNLSGDYENGIPEYHITSPAVDCSDIYGATLKFMRWLGVEQPTYDHAYVRISTNGTSWTTLWENGEEVTDNAWLPQEFDISAIADGQSTVYIRFTMGSTDGAWQYCGWNIDDVEISAYGCDASLFEITTTSLPDWTETIPYSVQLEAINGVGALSWSDKFGDLAGSGLTLSSGGLVSGTPSAANSYAFTALVEDEELITAEKEFSFTINSVVSISNTPPAEWTEGVVFNFQMTATGGTGTLSWTEQSSQLAIYGLTIDTDGLITGTPNQSGQLNFTLEVSDVPGSSDTEPFGIEINPAVQVLTESIPGGEVDLYYEYQLLSDGGTGAISWIDQNGDLSGTGLSLSAAGLLNGTPVTEGLINFTTKAEDQLGSFDTTPLSLDIIISFICGDANSDAQVNILDINYIIAYLYMDGPPPDPLESADINSDLAVNILDISGLIDFLYAQGDNPNCP